MTAVMSGEKPPRHALILSLLHQRFEVPNFLGDQGFRTVASFMHVLVLFRSAKWIQTGFTAMKEIMCCSSLHASETQHLNGTKVLQSPFSFESIYNAIRFVYLGPTYLVKIMLSLTRSGYFITGIEPIKNANNIAISDGTIDARAE